VFRRRPARAQTCNTPNNKILVMRNHQHGLSTICNTIEVTLFPVCVPCKKLDAVVESCTFASFFDDVYYLLIY
jgi:hypothetical protein